MDRQQQKHLQKLNCLERFFGTKWNDFLNNKKQALFLLLLGWSGVAFVAACMMQPQSGFESPLHPKHSISKANMIIQKHFDLTHEDFRRVDIIWGVSGVDRSSISTWDTKEVGNVIWDESFDPLTPESQQAIVDLCDNLKVRVGYVHVTSFLEKPYYRDGGRCRLLG